MASNYKKYLAATIATTVAASAAVTVVPDSAKASTFKDLEKDAYFYEAVVALTNQGVIKGYEDGTFRHSLNVTRGQAAAMIARALKIDQKKVADPGFTDIKKGQRFYNEIAAIFDAGIVVGVTKDRFEPNRTITRAEMSRIIANAFNLKAKNGKSSTFTDVPPNSWYAESVQALFDSGVTVGKTATTYAPAEKVNRGQIATFIYRAQQFDNENNTIESVTDSSVVIDGKSYKVAENLKSLFNSKNNAVLQNALIQFEEKDGTITNITSLEITEDGKSSGHLILDGGNATVKGEVIINGDYVTVKNLTVKGNFTVGPNVKNSFISDHLVVEGQTIVTDSNVSAASVSTAATNPVKIVFYNSTLTTVEVGGNDVSIELKGSSSVEEIKVSSNTIISADSGINIPKVTIEAGTQDVQINAPVQNLVIEDKDTQVTIKEGIKIENITIPQGSKVEDLIENYDQVKEDISKIDGQTNPDAGTPPVGGGGGGTPPDTTAPVLEGMALEIGGKDYIATNQDGVWTVAVSLDGLVNNPNQMLTKIKLDSNEPGEGIIKIGDKEHKVTLNESGQGETSVRDMVSDLFNLNIDTEQDGVNVGKLIELLNEYGSEIKTAILTIDGQEFSAIKENGKWKISLEELTDNQKQTAINLNVDESGVVSITIGDVTKTVMLDSIGEGTFDLSAILDSLDPTGVSVGILDELLNGDGVKLTATLKDTSGNTSDIELNITTSTLNQ